MKCFFIEPVNKLQRHLRRYASGSTCPGPWSYHNISVPFDVIEYDKFTDEGCYPADSRGGPPKSDPRWPARCSCGYEFTEKDEFQFFNERVYRRADTSEEMTLRGVTPGAMWYGDWMLTEGSNLYRGPDGHSLMVKLPNGNEWHIDGMASNCTMPDDSDHKCWVRHGDVPNITVDKEGRSCAAGAGSIQSGNYHGFLRNGEFVE
ncbi:MAG: hypothetical protein ABI977_03905 [Acidobacteriota bacterium]